MFGTPMTAGPAPSAVSPLRALARVRRSEQPWRKAAACKGLDPGFFHPDEDAPDLDELVEVAKDVCDTCAVRVACLEFALAAREPDGIWGGYTAAERRRELRRRRRSA